MLKRVVLAGLATTILFAGLVTLSGCDNRPVEPPPKPEETKKLMENYDKK